MSVFGCPPLAPSDIYPRPPIGLPGRYENQAPSFFFFFLNSNFYPGGHPFGQAGWLSTTQVLKGSLLPESGKDEKEKLRESVELRSRGSTS